MSLSNFTSWFSGEVALNAASFLAQRKMRSLSSHFSSLELIKNFEALGVITRDSSSISMPIPGASSLFTQMTAPALCPCEMDVVI